MIKLVNLCRRFQKREVLQDLFFERPDRGLVLLEGENGSGKSTLLSIVDLLDSG